MQIRFTPEMSDKVLSNQGLVHHVLKKFVIAPSDYEDLFQIGTIGLLKAVATFDESKKVHFSSYAITCINNELKMHFRKNNRHLGILSLNSAVSTANNGDELLLADIIVDSSSLYFTEQFEYKESLEKSISVILNYFSMRDIFILLLSTAEVHQKIISARLGISQSHISRAVAKLRKRLKEYVSIPHELINKKFSVSVINDKIKITCSPTNIEEFIKVVERVRNQIEQKNFRITHTNNTVTMSFPLQTESFEFLAEILYEATKYSVEFV